MPITFNCPQGHRLTCPDELAGKPGKCPKCGMVVRVPQPGAAVAAATLKPLNNAYEEPPSQLEEAAAGVDVGDLAADQIIFLCPNGHRLHGASSLAGRPGQCPHCGVRFLVPSPDEVEGDDSSPEEEVTDDPLLEIALLKIESGIKGGSSKSDKQASASNSALPASAPPLALLLSKLWRLKAQGVSIEIHLGDGKLLEPEQISLKDAHHALIVVREASGTHTLTAVAWSSIQRIVVRGLGELPKEWF